jgi:hypothetical protein
VGEGWKLTGETTQRGRVMRLPTMHGQQADTGPIHFVSDAGEEYLLIAKPSDAPGKVEDLSAETADQFEPYLDKDVDVSGDFWGSVVWRAAVVPD